MNCWAKSGKESAHREGFMVRTANFLYKYLIIWLKTLLIWLGYMPQSLMRTWYREGNDNLRSIRRNAVSALVTTWWRSRPFTIFPPDLNVLYSPLCSSIRRKLDIIVMMSSLRNRNRSIYSSTVPLTFQGLLSIVGLYEPGLIYLCRRTVLWRLLFQT